MSRLQRILLGVCPYLFLSLFIAKTGYSESRTSTFNSIKFKSKNRFNLFKTNTCTDLAIRLANSYDPQQITAWLKDEYALAQANLLSNLHLPGKAIGSIPAARSSDPSNSYAFHWVRDAGLVVDPYVTRYIDEPGSKREALAILKDFVNFSKFNQESPTKAGLGEPKFNLNGSPYDGPWNRPQNDSPAIRANSLMRFAHALLDEGNEGYVRGLLYDTGSSPQTVIKRDLEYVATHFKETSADLWEEVFGSHFFTLMVSRRALKDGAALARRLQDAPAADYYEKKAAEVEAELNRFWDASKGQILTTDPSSIVGWDRDKKSNLDAAVLLGSLHGSVAGSPFSVGDDRVLSTVQKLKESFASAYKINHGPIAPVGVALGRYPEDRYDGVTGNSQGGAWPLITLGMAELHYRLKKDLQHQQRIEITDLNQNFYQGATGLQLGAGTTLTPADPRYQQVLSGLAEAGDRYLLRVKMHAQPDGSLNEQIEPNHGHMQGAEDLSWNYAAMMTAIQERNRAR